MFRFEVTGMHCASCAVRVEKALAAVPGVQSVSVNPVTGGTLVEAMPGTARDRLDAAVVAAGYGMSMAPNDVPTDGVAPVAEGDGPARVPSLADTAALGERRRLGLALLLSLPLALPMLGMALGLH